MPVSTKPPPHQLAAALNALSLGRMGRAETLLRETLAAHPSNIDALGHLGLVTLRTNRPEEAERLFARVLRAVPKNPSAHNGRGLALARLGRVNEALVCFERAATLNPGDAETWNNRAFALSTAGRVAEALTCFETAQSLRPNEGAAHNNLGIALTRLGRFDKAVAHFDRALALEPRNPDFLVNLAVTRGHEVRFAEALEACDRAVALAPDHMAAHRGRGVALESLARYGEALAAYDQAIALAPSDVGALTGRANVQYITGQHEDALRSYAAAIAAKPDYADARWNESVCRLAMGDYEGGWERHEWRWQALFADVRPTVSAPLWLGDVPIDGKTILVVAEQGLGDSLQFCRYVPLLAKRADVVLEVPRPLVRLFGTLAGGARIIAAGDRRPAYDAWTPMLSLPLAFRTTLATVPAAVPYLSADPARAAAWRDRLAALSGRKIGLVWAGAPRPEDPSSHAVDRRRSMALEGFASLASEPGISLVSLQKGGPATQARTPPAGMTLHDWTDELDDFADTAALVEALDLVIGVDTSVVHLAGALARPVWVLNRYDQCWRWLHGRTDSPWYPTARLFQQRTPGDWEGVVRDVADALRDGP